MILTGAWGAEEDTCTRTLSAGKLFARPAPPLSAPYAGLFLDRSGKR